MKRKLLVRIVAVVMALLMLCMTVSAQSEEKDDILYTTAKLISYQKGSVGVKYDEMLLSKASELGVGTTVCDWSCYSLSRLGMQDDYDNYLAEAEKYVTESYKTEKKLDVSKATEWHRLSLAILAAGGDPTSFGTDADGNPIDLIADGTYSWTHTDSLGTQGVNGWGYALIVLDSMNYEIPDGAKYTRDDMIVNILSRQRPDGGFCMTTNDSDPDLTAMIIQSLAPYYESETEYEYVNEYTEKSEKKTVGQVVDEALSTLSSLQSDDGKFIAWGTDSSESVSQTIIALTSLGIDPLTDERFVKNGKTLYDVLLEYQTEKGGILHTMGDETPDPISCAQGLNALTALIRFNNGHSKFLDLSKGDKMTVELPEIKEPISMKTVVMICAGAVLLCAVIYILAVTFGKKKKNK